MAQDNRFDLARLEQIERRLQVLEDAEAIRNLKARVWKWRLKTNYPIVGGVTPTAGSLVFFGDVGGNFYAVDAANGQKLWGQQIGGAIGGGVITYSVNGAQKAAVATGFISPAWPVQLRSAKVAILGVESDTRSQ